MLAPIPVSILNHISTCGGNPFPDSFRSDNALNGSLHDSGESNTSWDSPFTGARGVELVYRRNLI